MDDEMERQAESDKEDARRTALRVGNLTRALLDVKAEIEEFYEAYGPYAEPYINHLLDAILHAKIVNPV